LSGWPVPQHGFTHLALGATIPAAADPQVPTNCTRLSAPGRKWVFLGSSVPSGQLGSASLLLLPTA